MNYILSIIEAIVRCATITLMHFGKETISTSCVAVQRSPSTFLAEKKDFKAVARLFRIRTQNNKVVVKNQTNFVSPSS